MKIRHYWSIGLVLLAVFLLFSASTLAQELPEKEVLLEWDEPIERENGDRLEPEEIGGYELRFYQDFGPEYESFVLVRGESPITSHRMGVPIGEHQFSIAAFDTNGLYSDFVNLTETVEGENAPESVLDFRSTVIEESLDRINECLEKLNCTVVE